MNHNETNELIGSPGSIGAREAAEALGVSRSTLNRWLKEGRIKGVKVGKQWRFSRAALRAVVDIGGPEAARRQESLARGLTALDAALLGHGMPRDRLAAMKPGAEAGPWQGSEAAEMVSKMMFHAMLTRASDLHLEPGPTRGVVRYRAGGALTELVELVPAAYDLVVDQWRSLAGLDPVESCVPQDGRIMLRIGGENVDVLIACLPSRHGQAVTLRFLDNDPATDFTAGLGKVVQDPAQLERVRTLTERPEGLIVVAGPTCSGKTTLKYAMLREHVGEGTKIMTAEAPVMQDLDGVTQTEVEPGGGLTFPRALRSIMRSMPDVVMCEDIRDLETAQLLTQMSLSGQKVLTTVYAADCLSAYACLLRSGVKPALLASAIQGVIATRLVRSICDGCATEYTPTEAEARQLAELLGSPAAGPLRQGTGCEDCRNTGFRGRLLLLEVSIADGELRDALAAEAPLSRIEEAMIAQGWRSFRDVGAEQVLAGRTTIKEVSGLLFDLARMTRQS